MSPEDAWGLDLWKSPPTAECRQRSWAVYDAFHDEISGLLTRMVQRYRRVVVLDLHTYNHRRQGPNAPAADALDNPEVNVGTGTMDRRYWAKVVDRFIVDLRNADFMGHHLDVRENVKFRGGHFPAWIHRGFPQTVCVLSIEFKKFFMDEWSGIPNETQVAAIERTLKSTVWGIYEELVRFDTQRNGMPA
jgi:N-formylglutamate amidohydrolase